MSQVIAFGMWLRDNCHMEKPNTWCYKWSEYSTPEVYKLFLADYTNFMKKLKTQNKEE